MQNLEYQYKDFLNRVAELEKGNMALKQQSQTLTAGIKSVAKTNVQLSKGLEMKEAALAHKIKQKEKQAMSEAERLQAKQDTLTVNKQEERKWKEVIDTENSNNDFFLLNAASLRAENTALSKTKKQITGKQEKLALKQIGGVARRIIPEIVSASLDDLNKAGYIAYIYGGAVRDYLLTVPINDYDIMTDCPREEIMDYLIGATVKNVRFHDKDRLSYSVKVSPNSWVSADVSMIKDKNTLTQKMQDVYLNNNLLLNVKGEIFCPFYSEEMYKRGIGLKDLKEGLILREEYQSLLREDFLVHALRAVRIATETDRELPIALRNTIRRYCKNNYEGLIKKPTCNKGKDRVFSQLKLLAHSSREWYRYGKKDKVDQQPKAEKTFVFCNRLDCFLTFFLIWQAKIWKTFGKRFLTWGSFLKKEESLGRLV